MQYLMGPGLTAELEYRRDSLIKTGESVARSKRRHRRARPVQALPTRPAEQPVAPARAA
jgi:hypothetical protein